MIPIEKADKIITMLQDKCKLSEQYAQKFQEMWQEEDSKSDKCQQKLEEFRNAAESLYTDIRELTDLANEVRKASGRKIMNV